MKKKKIIRSFDGLSYASGADGRTGGYGGCVEPIRVQLVVIEVEETATAERMHRD